ncbi:MAG: Rne/Rng family ribonuclease [Geminicoccaceae bacterium]
MPKSMLIDASHPEETRVVVVNDRQLEEFDFESSNKKQLKGNIYLAKVTRVEPSLQAAFVDYGGERHGFLAFSEIHPDYYQIPQADRKLLEEAAKIESEESDGDPAPVESGGSQNGSEDDDDSEAVTTDADEEAEEVFAEQAKLRQRLLRNYKIQEVIKRRQIILVQVVKEERGNKGAALTTYLSLAGRYCVLMPNTARGGGISRKIANVKDRSRLKAVAQELEVPDGMGLIIRTAGQSRNKLEIRRDYDYLLRLWSDIRDHTLESIAPCTIHEEGALVKRAIRDIYDSDIGEIQVEGDDGYKAAKKVMTMLMPSRARRVKQYKEELPLFHHYQIEPQLDALHSPTVDLKSGGSIVINPTEALTAIDVNSGRATRERNIEETALRTNSEAAEEIARQLRLRDVAGLVVIDFIDMTEMRNQRIVERRLRDALRHDRARIQLGRISAFGLLELSRQRLRPSFLEMSTQPCPACAGSGTIRSIESAALQALRAVEIEGMKGGRTSLSVTLPVPVAMYLLNQKRDQVVSLEQRYGVQLEIKVSDALIAGHFEIGSATNPAEEIVEEEQAQPKRRAGRSRRRTEEPAEDRTQAAEGRPGANGRAGADDAEGEEDGQRKRRRRRRSGDSEDGSVSTEASEAPSSKPEAAAVDGDPIDSAGDEDAPAEARPDAEEEPRSSRRRRRSPSRGRRRGGSSRASGAPQPAVEATASGSNGAADNDSAPAPTREPGPQPVAIMPVIDESQDGPTTGDQRPAASEFADLAEQAPSSSMVAETAVRPETMVAEEKRPARSQRSRRSSAGTAEDNAAPAPEADADIQQAAMISEPAEPRRGWWNRFVRKSD